MTRLWNRFVELPIGLETVWFKMIRYNDCSGSYTTVAMSMIPCLVCYRNTLTVNNIKHKDVTESCLLAFNLFPLRSEYFNIPSRTSLRHRLECLQKVDPKNYESCRLCSKTDKVLQFHLKNTTDSGVCLDAKNWMLIQFHPDRLRSVKLDFQLVVTWL